jgi:hypothetical protein
MKWKSPHYTKIYEALGANADGRVEIVVRGKSGKVYSSSRQKFYDIEYDQEGGSIMSNDNSSYWKGELGYPSIAFLMAIGELEYDDNLGNILKGIPWKDINQKFKNNFEKALDSVLSQKTEEEKRLLADFTKRTLDQIAKLSLNLLGKRRLPPDKY